MKDKKWEKSLILWSSWKVKKIIGKERKYFYLDIVFKKTDIKGNQIRKWMFVWKAEERDEEK